MGANSWFSTETETWVQAGADEIGTRRRARGCSLLGNHRPGLLAEPGAPEADLGRDPSQLPRRAAKPAPSPLAPSSSGTAITPRSPPARRGRSAGRAGIQAPRTLAAAELIPRREPPRELRCHSPVPASVVPSSQGRPAAAPAGLHLPACPAPRPPRPLPPRMRRARLSGGAPRMPVAGGGQAEPGGSSRQRESRRLPGGSVRSATPPARPAALALVTFLSFASRFHRLPEPPHVW